MRARYLCLASFSILIACGGESTTHESGNGAGGSSARGGSGGSATGGASGSGGFGGSLGGGSPCQPIMDSWSETMREAKACNPFVDSNECTATVPNAIVCSCAPTYVNPANSEAIAKFDQIYDEALAQGCLPRSCPAIACEQPVLGTCEPDASGNSGTCRDLYANGDPGP